MNSFPRIPRSLDGPEPATPPTCAVCGSLEVLLDEVVEAGFRLGLGECRHCAYRWTAALPREPVRQLRTVGRRQLAA